MLEEIKDQIQQIKDLWWLLQYNPNNSDEWFAAYWEQQTTVQRQFIENILPQPNKRK